MDNDMWTYGPWADFLLLGREWQLDEPDDENGSADQNAEEGSYDTRTTHT
jgi:hypothetical protein